VTDLLVRLQHALGDAFQIERELTGGGMSRVFLATEASLKRAVVVKVLPPELTSDVSAARFQQEIEVTARLRHPHILPVLTAGAREGLLYYVMPYVPGDSLRQRLVREGRLPIADAERILYEMADALALAHGRGIVHRDIKPENILLEEGHAMLADFGISRALAVADRGGRLTGTGMAVGTPGYMPPEQAAGERDVDAPADVYALAVVGYEMLAGAQPFQGATPHALLAAHLVDEPRPIRELRPEVPQRLEAALGRALAKRPEDRFETARGFRDAIAPRVAAPPPPRARRVWVAAALGAVAVAAGAAVLVLRAGAEPEPAVDAGVVMVMPFRVTGTDPGLDYLREGMVDLLAAKLTGEGGPRAVDPRSALAAWRRAGGTAEADPSLDATLEAARRLGSGRVLLGEIVGTGDRLVLSASLVPVGAGRTERANLEGPADSLLPLVDRLAQRLLTLGAGDERRRLDDATSASLPALRAYLEGRAQYRSGRYEDALGHFERALAIDTTFALAALGLFQTADWRANPLDPVRAASLAAAARHRTRLAPRDAALLDGFLGVGFPAPSSQRESWAAWERAVRAAPDQAEAWYHYGDLFFHWGRAMGVGDWRERATDAFLRAAELDSTFAAPAHHLVDIAAVAGDADETRRWARVFFAADSTPDFADYLRWRVAVGTGDQAAMRTLGDRYGSLSENNLRRILGWMQIDGIRLEDAPRVASAHRRALARPATPEIALWMQWAYLLNAGRPADADALLRELGPRFPGAGSLAIAARRLEAAIWSGADSTVARASAGVVSERVFGAAPEEDPAALAEAACLLARWELAEGDLEAAARAVDRGQELLPDPERRSPIPAMLCWATVEAMLARARDRPGWRTMVQQLDSLTLTGGITGPATVLPAVITPLQDVARLLEAAGDVPAARAAIARRLYHHLMTPHLASELREQGRLAALVGDSTAALLAYRHYLALRPEPEPALVPEVDAVRAMVATLSGGATPRD
jgi:eukaryotic-like serine/threonine-protein kinase